MGGRGGWLGAQGSHIHDQVRTALGEFVSLSATLPDRVGTGRCCEDSYTVHFQAANGVGRDIAAHRRGVGLGAGMTRVAGTEGTVWIESGTGSSRIAMELRDLPVPADLILPPPPPPSDDLVIDSQGIEALSRVCARYCVLLWTAGRLRRRCRSDVRRRCACMRCSMPFANPVPIMASLSGYARAAPPPPPVDELHRRQPETHRR